MAFRIFKPKKYHLGMTGDEVKEALQGGGGGSVYPEIKIKFTTDDITSGEVPAHSILRIEDSNGDTTYALLVTRESFMLPANGEVNCTTDLLSLNSQPIDISLIKVGAFFTEPLSQDIQGITGAIKIAPIIDLYFLYDKTEISVRLSSK